MKLLVTALLLAASPALAQDAAAPLPGPPPAAGMVSAAAPSASDLLFEQAQMRNAPAGATLTYEYLRRSSIAKGPFGPPLDDTIKLKLESGKTSADRNIAVEMFSGTNRFPAGPFEEMPGNPVIPLFLENHLNGLARVLQANPRYLKLAIRKGLRDGATVTPVKIDYKGRTVDGWQVVTRPFSGDAQAQRMRGMDNMTYTFVTSPEVPGEIVSIEAQSKSAEGGELLEERLSYDQKAG
ncbi:hypothetical protein [uncultured Methylobacterium sp.]|uniref:hypothetical protein n=1 Tax=uncultured Methylobacterium sp. TaxID=157278 RepID=UPI0035CA69EE